MKKVFVFLFSVLMPYMLYAQAPKIEWEKSYGGSDAEYPFSMIKTSDSGFAFTGWTFSVDGDASGNHGGVDLWVVKLSSSGALQWHKCIGGKDDDEGYSIVQTSDKGYVVAGNTRDSGLVRFKGDFDAWVVRLDSSGNLLWQKCFGGSGGDFAKSIIQTSDGGFAFAGYTNSSDGDITGINQGLDDFWVVKLSSMGTIEWQKCYGGSSLDQANSIIQTFDSGYAIAGWTVSKDHNVTGNEGYYDAWIIKLSSIGHLEWQKCLGGIGYSNTYALSILQISDSGYIIAGSSDVTDTIFSGNNGASDAWVAKLDSRGSMQWLKSYGGNSDDYAQSIIPTSDGGFAFTGTTYSGTEGTYRGLGDYWVVKLDSSGAMQWQKSLGGSDQDFGGLIVQSFDGGYVIGGWSASNNIDVSGNHGGRDAWIVKLVAVNNVPETTKPAHENIFLSPNPGSGKERISYDLSSSSFVSIKIFNPLGEQLRSFSYGKEESGIHEHEFDISDLPSGSYFLRINLGSISVLKPIELLH